jgi:hypothetical protein
MYHAMYNNKQTAFNGHVYWLCSWTIYCVLTFWLSNGFIAVQITTVYMRIKVHVLVSEICMF